MLSFRKFDRANRVLITLVALIVCVLVARLSTASAIGIAIDVHVSTHSTTNSTTIKSPAFSTTQASEVVLAFLGSDGPGAGKQTFSSVTGGGLSWSLRQRTNTQAGTAEIWQAVASSAISNATVTATRSSGSYHGSINVVSFAGADTAVNGVVASASAASGAPTVALTTTRAGSWVWAAGNDYDNARARTLGSGQTTSDQFVDTTTGDTYWTQYQTNPTPNSGTRVTINDTAPTTDRWNFAAIEILPAQAVDTTPPSVPANLTATAVSGTQVNLSWSSSTDNVGVAGYKIYRDGIQIATNPSTNYSDATVSPGVTYTYTVSAYDVAGNTSAQSIPATVTTPQSFTPPVVTINSKPAANSNSSSAAFSFSATNNSDPGGNLTYACMLDASTPVSCTSPQTYSSLTDGQHSFSVTATDTNDGLTSNPAAYSWQTDTAAPSVNITAPADGSTVSGATTVSADASDNASVTGVQFLLDGSNLGSRDQSSPYSFGWDTTGVSNGLHVLSAQAYDAAGNVGIATNVSVIVDNPIPVGPTIDPSTPAATPVQNNVLTTSSPTFSPPAGTVLYAVFSMDSASYTGSITTVSSITNSGTPLTWHLLGRENGHSSTAGGFVEVWWASNPNAQTGITATATFSQNTKNVTPPVGDFQILVMDNAAADQSNATWASNALLTSQNNSPTVTMATSQPNSQVFGIFDNWNNGQTPVPGNNQSIQSIVLNSTDVDGYWIQKQNSITAGAQTSVTMNATDPGQANEWHALAWEVLAAGSIPPAPTINLSAVPATINTGDNSTLSWTSTNATSCSAVSPTGWTASTATSDSQAVSPTSTTTYVLSCTGAGGTTQSTTTVTVNNGGNIPVNISGPVVTGTVATGSVLSTSNGNWSNSPTSFSYQWQQCANDGTNCAPISGATNSTYTVTAGDSNHTLTAVVTAANGGGSASATAPIVPLIDNFPGNSLNTDLWTKINQQGETSQAEVECYDNWTVANNQLTMANSYDPNGFTCPAGSSDGKTKNSYSSGSSLPSTIPINMMSTKFYPIAPGTCAIYDGVHSQAFTTSGASAGSAIPVTSGGTWNFSFASGSHVACPTMVNYHAGAVQQIVPFTYGTISVKAKMPDNPRTTWPAIWLLGAACQHVPASPALTIGNTYLTSGGTSGGFCNWPNDANDANEIDIFEGYETTVATETSWQFSGGVSKQCKPTISDYSTNYHIYEFDWNPGSMAWKIDGVTKCTLTGSQVPSHPMFLILDSAIQSSSSISPSDLPQSMTVDYVHVSH